MIPFHCQSPINLSISPSIEHRRFKRGTASIRLRSEGSWTSHNGVFCKLSGGRDDFLGGRHGSKSVGTGVTLPADAGGPSEQPVRATPFWNGVIFGFADNFYMGALDDIDFAVRLEIPIVQFEKISDSGLLNDLHENGRNYYRMEIVGKIVRTGSDAEIFLRTVTLNGHALLNRHGENIEWFTVIGAEVEAQRKQRLAEAILNSLTDSVHVIPANRYLTINETETEVPTLTSNSYKSWLHNQSLSRSGFDTFKLVRKRLNEPPFSYGDISFVKDGHSIDIMVDDGCGYRMPVASKGTGVQQILVLLGYMSASRARVIGIEEPELNLSFKSQDDLITTLLELLRSETSKHNSDILYQS